MNFYFYSCYLAALQTLGSEETISALSGLRENLGDAMVSYQVCILLAKIRKYFVFCHKHFLKYAILM